MILPREPCLGLAMLTAGCVHTALVQVGPSFCAYPTDLLRAWCSRAIAGPKPLFKKLKGRASLVVQWLRVRLPMQGTRVRAPVQEDPTCRGVAGPVSRGR